MPPLNREDVLAFANREIQQFHASRLAALERIDLHSVLRRKNPYLFRAKNIQTASELVASMLDALLSSSEEKMFGDFLERLAIYISEQVSGGRKSSAPGIDLEFERDNTLYLVSIKSGPNWGNSAQYQALKNNFQRAIRVQRQAAGNKAIQPVLGICYGRTRTADNGLYLKVTGQSFWHFISEDADFFITIVEPIGHRAAAHNDAFREGRANLVEQMSAEFAADFANPGGTINWEALIRFNSGNLPT